jgi:sortase A
MARPSPSPVAISTATPAATPDILSESGAARPTEPTELVERVNSRPPRLALPAPAVTLPAAGPSPAALAGAGQERRDPAPPDRIVAPTIRLDSRIIPVGWKQVTNADGSQTEEWEVASYAVSWHKTSAKLGEVGNTVLTGHNNIEGEVFRHLEHLNVGDAITLYAGDRAHQYKVTDRFIVREKDVPYEQRLENGKWIGPFPDERVTLLSCWPYTGNTHRIFIIAKPVTGG